SVIDSQNLQLGVSKSAKSPVRLSELSKKVSESAKSFAVGDSCSVVWGFLSNFEANLAKTMT
ncbi:MAG: hypothetical protein IJT11_07745, partial [Bacteroidaceae bacterium]|nr:hypothetical protein [Bacteroidaceae bacterium]